MNLHRFRNLVERDRAIDLGDFDRLRELERQAELYERPPEEWELARYDELRAGQLGRLDEDPTRVWVFADYRGNIRSFPCYFTFRDGVRVNARPSLGEGAYHLMSRADLEAGNLDEFWRREVGMPWET